MATSIKDNYQELVKKRQEIASFGEIEALLSWDQTVNMPPKGNAKRALQMEALSGMVHDIKTSSQLGSLLEKLKDAQQSTDLNERERAVVRDSIREYKQQTAIPRELATRIAKLNAESYDAWVTAKKQKDFSIFKPFLQQLVDVSIEKAKLIDPTRPAYEVLMDDYERGLTCAKVDVVFGEIKKSLVPLIEKIKAKPAPNTDFLKHEFDVDIQAKVSQQITKELGFDLERGRLDVSVHPFTTTIGAASDVRITSLYKRDDVITGLGATIHETGHALYEQGLDPEYAGLPSGNALSMGIHESQSLLWERMVGLSQPFWNHYYPLLLSSFSCLPRDSTSTDFYGAINLVTPSKIRVEADEVTYPLHIIIRYEIESGLISGKIKVDDDLPKLWNQKMQEYLGVKIDNDAEGILQDIHWSMGAFGYFPTYTLGAIYASQFFKAAQQKIPNLDEQIGKGDFKELKAWLNSNIHVHGALYPTGDELCKRVTGEELSAANFINHLTDKYTKLYKL